MKQLRMGRSKEKTWIHVIHVFLIFISWAVDQGLCGWPYNHNEENCAKYNNIIDNWYFDYLCPTKLRRYGACDGCCCPRASPSDYCNTLSSDEADGWKNPFRGYDENGKPVPCLTWNYCGDEKDKIYRVATNAVKQGMESRSDAEWRKHFGEFTNRLRFKDPVIAQEGLSFCIVGRHYRKTMLSLWEPLEGFLPLAEKSFDIGNHIHPYNSDKMNTFRRPKKESLIRKDKAPWIYLKHHEFDYVWVGTREVHIDESTFDEGEIINRGPFVELHSGFENRPAHPEWQPDPSCENPYIVIPKLIRADGNTLHNYLHITVLSEPKSQEGKNCPTGKMKLLMLEVRDQDGYPVGQFTDDIPCDEDERTLNAKLSCPVDVDCRRYTGKKVNHVPCMFSHPRSAVHPMIFMASASSPKTAPGGQGGPGGGGNPDSTMDACRDSTKPQHERKPPTVSYEENTDEYFTEVHATWRFAQASSSWISELHFATLIIEDEKPIQYYTSRQSEWMGPAHTKHCTRKTNCRYGECGERCWTYQEWNCCWIPQIITECCWRFTHYWDTKAKTGIQLALLNRCEDATHNTNRPYGYSARYRAIKPNFATLGGWDHFMGQYISPKDVDCHEDISFGSEFYYTLKDPDSGGENSKLPLRQSLSDYLKMMYTLEKSSRYAVETRKYGPISRDFALLRGYESAAFHSYGCYGSFPIQGISNLEVYELADWHTFGATYTAPDENGENGGEIRPTAYYGKTWYVPLYKMFRSAHQDPIVLKSEFPNPEKKEGKEHFGSAYLDAYFYDQRRRTTRLRPQGLDGLDLKFTFKEMAKDSRSRCPCPFVPTTLAPELQTKHPVEIEGRRLHVANMMLAWVVLVPLSFFVARFFKETFSRVFFLQEFWWYTIHFLSLITALLFTIGGIYGLYQKRSQEQDDYEVVWTDATKVHVYCGYGLIGVFVIHLILGPFRFYDIQLRLIQMALHWGIGWIEYLFAVATILSAAAIPSGVMSCTTFGIYCGFLVYQLIFTLGMEYHMRIVDNKLELNPPRAYLPSPMMRVFHKDAPYSKFRVIMLGVYFLGCLVFYAAIHIAISLPDAEFSCFQPTASHESQDISSSV